MTGLFWLLLRNQPLKSACSALLPLGSSTKLTCHLEIHIAPDVSADKLADLSLHDLMVKGISGLVMSISTSRLLF